MKLKLDAEGHAVLSDGKPVYIHDDGKEVAFDAPSTVSTIARINGEARANRERYEAAEAKLKPFEGLTDPEAARKALEIVANLDQKKLVDAGQIETIKAEAIKAVEEKYKPIVAERDKLQADLYGEKIGGAFSRSKLIAEKFAIPADIVQARFGQNFKIEDGKTVAYDASGNKLFSRAKPGEVAEFEEALELLVDQYPYKDNILKGTVGSGGGATGGTVVNGKRTILRSEFDNMDPATQRTTALDKTVTLVD